MAQGPPQDGVQYRIKLQYADKWVHMKGGSAQPRNDTELVYHEGKPGHTMFVLKNGQMQHFRSGKFIHPKGGTAGDDTALCVHDGFDGARTGLIVKRVEGHLYLYHAKHNKYVHPRGGSANPSNNTVLVYHEGYRPNIAIELRRADGGGDEIEGIRYELVPILLFNGGSGAGTFYDEETTVKFGAKSSKFNRDKIQEVAAQASAKASYGLTATGASGQASAQYTSQVKSAMQETFSETSSEKTVTKKWHIPLDGKGCFVYTARIIVTTRNGGTVTLSGKTYIQSSTPLDLVNPSDNFK